MALDDLSQRQRFWLFVVMATLFMALFAWWNRPQPGNNAQQAQNNAAQQKPAEKAASAPEKKEPAKPQEKPAGKAPEVKAPEVKPAPPAASLDALLAKLPDEEHVLGDEKSKIRAVFSGRGAAVRQVTLNDYEASDRMTGQRLPVNGDGQRPRFVLLTDNEYGNRAKLPLSKQFEALSYRFAIVGDDDKATPELQALAWKKEPGASAAKVVYTAEVPGKNLKVTKTFTLDPAEYHVGLELRFDRLDPAKPAVDFAYELTGPRGIPVEGLRWKQVSFRHNVIETQHPESKSLSRTMEGVERFHASKEPHLFNMNEPRNRRTLLYAGVVIQFFASLAVVDHPAGEPAPDLIEKVYSEWAGNDEDVPEFYDRIEGQLTTRLVSRHIKPEKEAVTDRYLLYAGPSKVLTLKFEAGVKPGLWEKYRTDWYLGALTESSDVGSFFETIGITRLLVTTTNFMHHLLEYLHGLVGNYGVAIILMTVLVRALLFPISRKQALNQARMQERMKPLKPELEKLKQKFGNDRQAFGLAQLELYKKHGINPMTMGCSGCWLVFLQMPVFLGLYFALRESVHLRMASFLWIDNLAMPDMLVHWGDNVVTDFWFHLLGMRVSLFYLGPYLNILPIISVTLMFMYQKLMAPPAMDAQQEQQLKMMNYMMLFFGFAFYWVASGLCIYFILSSAWGMIERKFTKKAKERIIADLQAGRTGEKDKQKPASGLRGKLGNYWRDLQSRADKRT